MELLAKAGPFIWPILVFSLIAVYCILDRMLHFGLHVPRINRELEEIVQGKKMLDTPTGHLAPLLARAVVERRTDADLLELALERDLIDAERRLTGLNMAAQVAPLLGLLGTVSGLINAFRNIQAAATVNPGVLAGGIWEALLATVAGLCVAIPSLIAYVYFSSRVTRWENYLQRCVAHVTKQLGISPREEVA
jgi:biopolymer transport protein ExbB